VGAGVGLDVFEAVGHALDGRGRLGRVLGERKGGLSQNTPASRRHSTSRRTARQAAARSPCACSCTPCITARACGCRTRFGRGAPSTARASSDRHCLSCPGRPPSGSDSSSFPWRATSTASGRPPGSMRLMMRGVVSAGAHPRGHPSRRRPLVFGEEEPRSRHMGHIPSLVAR
jgi:hypothetical protein